VAKTGPPRDSGLSIDLLRVPGINRFFTWQHARSALQLPLLVVAALVVYDGLFGPQIAPRNLAGVAPWVQGRGVAVLALLLAGNLTCMACPFVLSRNLSKRLLGGRLGWPNWLNAKWLAAGLLIAFFWFYEAFDPWALPWLTAAVAFAYFGGAFVVNGLFRGMVFCKYLCPLGHFNFVNSLMSPLEVKVRQLEVCAACRSKDCIKGRGGFRGCEQWLFQQRKAGNMDCTFCLDCSRACPMDNVGLVARVPGRDLWEDRPRSGIGRMAERVDLATLVMVVVFGAFMNAFGMVGPFYPLAEGLAALLGTQSEWVVLLVLFGVGMVLLPLMLVSLVGWASRSLAGSREPILTVVVRHSYGLIPMGFGMWLAHYAFHFLTGGLTLIPVAQSFLLDVGLPVFGTPHWGLASLVPAGWLVPIELGLLEMGWLVSLVASYRIAASQGARPHTARAAFLPWALLVTGLFLFGAWLMLQPMEMRGVLA
jgi:ferredoxin